ncbi:MAG: adenylate/guanylate cyclase domain-containing protein [Myxococcales bacterium]
MTRPPSAQALAKLLAHRNEHPERLYEIDQQIRERFEQTHALLVLDMCGFSRLTVKYGIIHYLAMIQRMQRVVLPLVTKAGGRVLKTEADNVFAVFPDVPQALGVALAATDELEQSNLVMPRDWDVHVSVGIGYGPLLMVGEHDAFGSEMNLASKLGEDMAKAEQVLLTEAAWARMGAKKRAFVSRMARISGMRFPYYEHKRDKGQAKSTSARPSKTKSKSKRKTRA